MNTSEYRVESAPIDGLAIAVKDGKYGFVDVQERVVVPFLYKSVTKFQNGFSIVEKDGMKGVIDTAGKEVIPPVYEYVRELSDGLFYVMKAKKFGVVNQKHEVVVPLNFTSISILNKELLFAGQKNEDGKIKYGLIDWAGNALTLFKYDSYNLSLLQGISSEGNRLFLVLEQETWSVMEAKGEKVTKVGDLPLPKGYSFVSPQPEAFKGTKYLLVHAIKQKSKSRNLLEEGYISLDGLKFFDE